MDSINIKVGIEKVETVKARFVNGKFQIYETEELTGKELEEWKKENIKVDEEQP